MLKVVRTAFNIGEVWNPVCCHGNKTFKLVLRGEEQNREEGEMAQKKLGGGRKRNVTI